MKKTQDANKKIAKQAAENKSMESPWRLAMKRLSRNKLAIAGLILFRSHDRSLYCGTNRISVFRYYSN